MDGMKAVKVYSVQDRITAEMLLDILDQAGISAYRQGVGSGGIMDIYAGNSMFGEDIYVDEGDAERAYEIIEGFEAPVSEDESEE